MAQLEKSFQLLQTMPLFENKQFMRMTYKTTLISSGVGRTGTDTNQISLLFSGFLYYNIQSTTYTVWKLIKKVFLISSLNKDT